MINQNSTRLFYVMTDETWTSHEVSREEVLAVAKKLLREDPAFAKQVEDGVFVLTVARKPLTREQFLACAEVIARKHYPSADLTVSPAQDTPLTLAQQARVNLILVSLALRDDGQPAGTGTAAFVAAQCGVTANEFKLLHGVASACRARASRPFGHQVPPAEPFSQRTHSVEIDESAEAHLARGNQAFALRQLAHAYDSYVAALDAAERA